MRPLGSPSNIQLPSENPLDRLDNVAQASALAAADVEYGTGGLVVDDRLQCVDEVVNENKISDDGPISSVNSVVSVRLDRNTD